MSTSAGDAQSITTKRPPTPPVLLVVEQDQALRGAISSALRREGYVVLAVADAARACELACENQLSLILLDAYFFHAHGCALYHRLRAGPDAEHVPLLLLIDRDSEVAHIESSGARADDYIVKPLRWEELSACVSALLRRRTLTSRRSSTATRRVKRAVVCEDEPVLIAGGLLIDIAQRKVFQDVRLVELKSALLFNLLVHLVRHQGAVLTREQLLSQVWGYDCTEGRARDTRTVVVHIHWLRDLLDDDARESRLIQTVPGLGYRFAGAVLSYIREREQTGRHES